MYNSKIFDLCEYFYDALHQRAKKTHTHTHVSLSLPLARSVYLPAQFFLLSLDASSHVFVCLYVRRTRRLSVARELSASDVHSPALSPCFFADRRKR